MLDPRSAIADDGSVSAGWRLEPWPNAIGLDVIGAEGEWGVVTPELVGRPPDLYRAMWVPAGEMYPTLYGEGQTPQEAILSAEPIGEEAGDA